MSLRRRLLFSYAPDWIITAVLSAIFFSLNEVHGFRRRFSVEDETCVPPLPTDFSSVFQGFASRESLKTAFAPLIRRFAVHERVPDWALYIIAVASPAILQALIDLVTLRSWWDLHNGWLGLALSLSITGSITQVVKITVGRPRPDILDRCQPPAGTVDPVFGLSDSSICTTQLLLEDGFRSFPSGHSSLSFAGLGFLAFYLAGKLHLFDKRGYVASAALVAISRTMDSRHHWEDVLTGSILGTTVAYFSYRQYYPNLASEVSHLPYSPRITNELVSHHPRASREYRDDHRPTEQDVFHSGPLEGTVLRQGPSSLRDAWRGSDEETTALHHQPTPPRSIPLETV
ncbi:acidPPc domain-containing protein [Mycena chlorophos]|uniref:AcidPPc domain-containing protein n=1 Tax=Mycena chlorophos TaxID=658473 RepID=A0A8H6TTN5_MYCCL|nr:acidPPc domain-containing protein [Mycena chlorophos]